MDLPPLSFHASLKEQWDEEEELEEIETVLKVVPHSYHQYLGVFSKVKAEKLPPHHACDHHIELEGLLPPIGNVEKGFIRPSSSSTGAHVLFVNKNDKGPCLCVDYCKLNAVTRKNRYPVPPMSQLLTAFNGSTIFSKIDLCGAYNLLRIKEGDEQLTAFRTKYGSYEYLVMPFGFTNAPASFQNLVNDIFSDFLDVFVVVYLDDIMVFSNSEEEHLKHVTSVLQMLRENNLFAKASKCVFHASSVEYLGYVVSSEDLKTDPSNIQQILNWPQSKNIKALQSFLGFANFYHCFIKNYSKKITSLTCLLKEDFPFIFNKEALSQFQILKEAFTTAPILAHFNPSLQTIVEAGASDYALGAVLSQVNDSGKHPIAFDSRKMLPAELNYEIHDKELLGIFWAFKCWGDFLLSLSIPFEATLPDALAHWDNVYPERGVDFISKNPQNFHQVIKQDGAQESRFFSIKVEIFSDLVDNIQKEVWQDNGYKEILKQLARGESVPDYSLEPQAKLLLFKERVLWTDSQKMAIFIPAYGEINALDLPQIFIHQVISKHGLPVSIVSDRGSLFVSSFWTQLCQQLKISIDLSTAFNSETDGQKERVNQILEQCLWMYVSYHQDDWHTWLALAELAYNNAEHTSTKKSPFFTIYQKNPIFDLIHVSQDSPAGKLSTKLQSVQQVVKEELESEIRRFKKYADRSRAIPSDFQPGDNVWLASKSINTTRPTKKLLERWLGPFEVIKEIGSHAYHSKLPQQWKSAHPVFHVSLLKPVKQSAILN
ncbi:hypothetical protein O181_049958 [Austropuccinia psidii MF-1]|uniref:Reverse transcriptase domain-containing protein n=1 Tax=Austropuccinia psidii MF-1 TaxID=1389203 RepID=A0A9Q3DYF6_9BASI|nr:hypothetical protein [Austropuccinia psidii MF-1]